MLARIKYGPLLSKQTFGSIDLVLDLNSRHGATKDLNLNPTKRTEMLQSNSSKELN